MQKLTAKEIANMSGGTVISGKPGVTAEDVSIDSRECSEGSLFVALKGEITDGHRFLSNAYDNGARILMISDQRMARDFAGDLFDKDGCAIVEVEDTLIGLQELAREYYQDMAMDSVAITGSVGKTTTRDMVNAALAQRYSTGTNKRNYNSETGLPLTLLSFTPDMEVGVLEMGMDGPGQISRLAELATPEIAIITNIGISHIERLGSRENIFKAKMEITENFDSENILIINSDDDLLGDIDHEALAYQIVKVGQGDDTDYRVENIRDLGVCGISFELYTPEEKLDVEIPIPGKHNAINCGLAIAAAEIVGVSPKTALQGIGQMTTTGYRLKLEEARGIKIINDAYNASPESMESALSTLSHTDGKRRIAILGGMNELGQMSEEKHRQVGRYAADCNIDLLITIGEMAEWIADEASDRTQTMTFEEKEELYDRIGELFREGDVILIKASRSYELEKLAEEITK